MKREAIIQGFPTCVALLIFVVSTAGCVGPAVRTYSGDNLQKSEVAVIKGWCFPTYFLAQSCVHIYTFDEKKLEATKVEALPGRHELVIEKYSIGLFPSVADYVWTEFIFEAGHEYKIKDSFFRNRVEIINVNTGVTIFSEAWLR